MKNLRSTVSIGTKMSTIIHKPMKGKSSYRRKNRYNHWDE